MSRLDAALLDRLGAALETMPSAPRAAEIAAFRRLVGERRASTSTVVEMSPPPIRRRVRRVALAAALAATLVLGSGAVALATGGPFSGVARRAAFALGLPVDSPELSSARNALAGLRDALAGHDDRQIADARQVVDRRLAALSTDDARDVSGEARLLLREARERLAGDHDQGEHVATGGGGRDGGGPSAGAGGPRRGVEGGSGGGNESSPNAGPSSSGSGADGGGASPPTTPSGGSGGSGDGGGSHDGGSDGGSGGGGS